MSNEDESDHACRDERANGAPIADARADVLAFYGEAIEVQYFPDA